MATVSENVTWANGSGGGTALNATNLNNFRKNLFDEFNGNIDNNNIKAAAAIAFSKLAALTDGNILVGNGSNVATSVAVTGDVTISNAGVTAIAAGAIVNADINASAAIVGSKLDLSEPGAIGGTTAAAGSFTTLTASTSLALATGATCTGINDTDNFSDASATTLATSESIKAYADTKLTGLSSYTTTDSDSNALASTIASAPHAYLAQSDGMVTWSGELDANSGVITAYVHTTSNPPSGGTVVAKAQDSEAQAIFRTFSFFVPEGQYFEIVNTDTDAPGSEVITWISFGTLAKPVDQD